MRTLWIPIINVTLGSVFNSLGNVWLSPSLQHSYPSQWPQLPLQKAWGRRYHVCMAPSSWGSSLSFTEQVLDLSTSAGWELSKGPWPLIGAAASACWSLAPEFLWLCKLHNALRLPTYLVGRRVLRSAVLIALCRPGVLPATLTLLPELIWPPAYDVEVPPPGLRYFRISSPLLLSEDSVLTQHLHCQPWLDGEQPRLSFAATLCLHHGSSGPPRGTQLAGALSGFPSCIHSGMSASLSL